MIRVDVVYTLLYNERDDQVLMVQNKKHDNWSLPGGAVEEGETLVEAASREMREETGLTVEVGNVLSVNEAFIGNHHAHFFTFQGRITNGTIAILDTETIAEAKWMNRTEADEWMPYYQGGIQTLLKASVPYVFQG
ncbi:NUDIX hydrolase [Pseudalkalibacillus hwajinpoensis]|uniref:NUDIX hydrolase n=1 Tax=Guptibacillus hwajinpoensis TaxID=208199 RepID=UPI001CD58240|nr:NUDIX hydrolase [Pseudalkalibacillus hwajinpoensis]MCA0992227.1 NUDIX hydrolase [Pseudalkalibacillus hwajinpoensis]